MIELFGTLGPSCRDKDTLRAMFENGMSGMRLNLSHTGLAESEELIRTFQAAAEEAGVKPELLIDLQGPELRVLPMKEPLVLNDGGVYDAQEIPLPDVVRNALSDGDEILLDDGKISLRLEKNQMRVLRGGTLQSRKSVKIVNKSVPMPALTETDRKNLSIAKEYGVSAVMQPFVRNAEDIHTVRLALHEYGADTIRIFSKIENRDGLARIDEIIDVSDMIVIARGDLGNDVPLPKLPGVQKDIAARCLAKHIPFLVVTQMLTSMIDHPVPTRAEVSDIFNAVTDGASAVMVTNETAVGSYPAEVIRFLRETADAAEQWIQERTV